MFRTLFKKVGPLAVSSLVVTNGPAATLYVDVNSTNPAPPYVSWGSAATNIQDAVDAAVAGDEILVTNGVYQTGGRALFGTMTNRVFVDKPVAVQSMNGPEVTMIYGYQLPGTTNGDGAVRCVYLSSGASLSGFTLTHGATDVGGLGGGISCESTDSVVTNCVLTGNSASDGGGAFGGSLINCQIVRNSSTPITGTGGGAYTSILRNCVLTGNSAGDGGAAFWATLDYCTICSNSATFSGGGPANSTLNNCLVFGNSANTGGGASGSLLNNCTVTGNSATVGGGIYQSDLNNCILYFNSASSEAPNYAQDYSDPGVIVPGLLSYCCTTPMPTNGVGNITNAPFFIDLAAGNFHLQPRSPCIDTGTNLSGVITNDLDGRPRPLDGNADGVAAFDIGAYEHSVLFVRQNSPSPTPPYNSWVTAATNIQDTVELTLAGAGDQILVTNGVYGFGGDASERVALNNALTTMQSVNGPQATIIDGGGAVRCVLMTNGTFLSGFTLTNGHALDSGGGVGFLGFQSDAVVSNCVILRNSAPSAGGAGSVLVTGGSQPVGGSLLDCVLSNNSATAFQPGNPTLGIGGAADNCKLSGCTLVSNFAAYGGGGASASRLVNCRVTGNSANAEGGGARWSWLYNCVVSSNSSGTGGSYSSTLVNCTMTANSSGGAYFGFLTNCIVYDNGGFGNQIGATLNNCCTIPLPGSGIGNFTNAPLFVNPFFGNFRLQSNSPCINAGNNAVVTGSVDLDGRPRIVSGAVDVGAYEFQPGVSGDFIGWLAGYGLPTDGSADFIDSDNDGMNNWQEWIAGTSPTDSASALRLLQPIKGVSGVTVTWQSVTNRIYLLERASSVGAQPSFSPFADNIVGQAGTTSYLDTNILGSSTFFYRVRIE
jgi:hypothetical protein